MLDELHDIDKVESINKDDLLQVNSGAVEIVTAMITTIPSRFMTFCRTIESIYDQVDKIIVVFNGFEFMESVDNLISGPKYDVYTDTTNQYTDSAKWAYTPESGYVVIVDDDIEYPPDYVERMIAKVEQYNRKAVCIVHGSFFEFPFFDFKTSKRSFHFVLPLQSDVRIPLIGTGTLVFHTDTIRPTLSDFSSPSRSDIWFSSLCLKREIPMYAIERPEAWLKPLQTPANDESLWDKMEKDQSFHDENSRLVRQLILPYITSDICSVTRDH